jgi:hypothetical protein
MTPFIEQPIDSPHPLPSTATGVWRHSVGRQHSGDPRTPSVSTGLQRGWLIARLAGGERSAAASTGEEGVRYLQVGTGQWCPAESATWFPLRSAAAAYAADLCRQGASRVAIVFRQR